jgi:hypothetical protein
MLSAGAPEGCSLWASWSGAGGAGGGSVWTALELADVNGDRAHDVILASLTEVRVGWERD